MSNFRLNVLILFTIWHHNHFVSVGLLAFFWKGRRFILVIHIN